MKCPNCGKEIPEGKKFCGFCGAKIVAKPLTEDKPVLKEKIQPEQTVKQKTTKNEGKRAKWIIPVLVLFIAAAIVFAYLFIFNQPSIDRVPVSSNTSSSMDRVPDSANTASSSNSFSGLEGTWRGEKITIIFNDKCDIDVLCGEFKFDEGASGGLIITYVDGNKFGFYNPEGSAKVYEEWVRIIDAKTLEWYSNSEFGESNEFLKKQ